MAERPRSALVDTDVFSILLVNKRSADPRVDRWRELLAGSRVLISFQTRSEVLAGALSNKWGESRLAELRAILDQVPTIGVDDAVIEAHAALYARCRLSGHALHSKEHNGDRWIAACAIAKGVALLAGDAIFLDTPGLMLLTDADAGGA